MNTSNLKSLSARLQRGVSLIESTIVMSVLATTVGLVVPGFQQAQELQRLKGTAALLETDLQHARSAAVAMNRTVRFSFESRDGATCYVVHTGAAGDCRCTDDGAAACTTGAQALRSERFGADAPLRVTSNSASLAFDADKGTVTPTASIRVVASSGAAIHQVVNIMGRVRSCSPTSAVGGIPRC